MSADGRQPDDDEQIVTAEEAYIAARREKLGALASHGPSVGLALSGGGIRSATLSLGVLCALSRMKLIHKFDYLSTVSGGGYTGAFYASFFTPPDLRDARGGWEVPPTETPDPLGTPDGQRAIRHLRENGRYLLTSGAGDAAQLATIAVRGWLAIHLVIGVALLTIFLLAKVVQALLAKWQAIHSLEFALADRNWPDWLWPIQWLEGYPIGNTTLLSPLWPISAFFLAVAVATGWGYWLARYDTVPVSRWARALLGPATVGTALIALVCLYWPPAAGWFSYLPLAPNGFLYSVTKAIGCTAIGALLSYVLAEWISWRVEGAGPETLPSGTPREQENRVRNRLTGWTAWCLLAALIIGALALVDTVAQTLYARYLEDHSRTFALPLAGGAVLAILTPLVRRVITWAQSVEAFADFIRRFGRTLALVLAIAGALVLATIWATIAQYLAWRGGPIGGEPGLIPHDGPVGWSLSSLAAPAIAFTVISIGIGISFGFLNLSSFSAFYAGRLRRAYLGASNVARMQGEGKAINRDDPGDDIALTEYYMSGTGAPLHLINVTINETTGRGGSSIVQRDRKGRPLTLSPAGYLSPTESGKRKCIPFTPATGKLGGSAMPLSSWVAVSGAAFSTGLGRNTSLGLSLLAGLSNLRLGVWWTPPDRSRLLMFDPRQWVQPYLWSEFLAQFQGPSGKRWYLTDGGHFENTGIYELVRRRVPLIVACDNGADPDYNFEDIVNLTRKLRIDFKASLEFLPGTRLDDLFGEKAPIRSIFGELSELVRLSKERSSRGPYAAVARIRIPASDAEEEYLGTLILLKPRLSGLEMIDLLDYHRINPDFPQQTTGDQFFDEAQWESYFRLGTIIAELVFADTAGSPARWSPRALAPLDSKTFAWFDDDWLGQQPSTPERKSAEAGGTSPAIVPASSPERPAATQAGIEKFGTGRFLAGTIAALGTLGVAAGVSQSLTSSVTQGLTSSSSGQVSTLALNEGDRNLFESGITVHYDEGVTQRLDALLAKLDILIGRTSPGDERTVAQLTALRASLANFRQTQDPALLQPLLREAQGIRGDMSTRGQVLHADLDAINRNLISIAQQVRETGPRRNVRGGQ